MKLNFHMNDADLKMIKLQICIENTKVSRRLDLVK